CLTEWDYKIFEESPEAWAHGPVFPSVYEKYSSYRYMNIGIPKKEISLHDRNLERLILKIALGYGVHSAKDLEKLTHREDPWKKARKRAGVSEGESCKEIILDSDIREYFEKLLRDLE
ncbi:MAG: Panacea domain-containing protein, partial [Cetobacterium sp.]